MMIGILASFFESRSLENPATSLASPDSYLYDSLGAMKSSAGVSVNRETALSLPAIWRGVNLISRDTGKLPCHIQKRSEGGWVNDTEHVGYGLLRHKPNDAMTAMVFRQTLQGHAILEGNGYAYIARNGAAEPEELIILAPRQVTPVRVNGELWYVYQFIDGEQRKIRATDVIHIKGFSYDGLIAYNLVHKARETLGLAIAQQTYSSIFFRNDARPSLVLQTPGKLSKEGATNLRSSWERLYSGLENKHRTAVLEEGLEAKIISQSATESQLIEQMKYGLVDVSNLLGIPPHKVGSEGGRSYASLEQENQAYLDEGLDPWLVTHEEEYRDKLLTEKEKRDDTHRVRFARKELLRANLSARGLFYTQMLQWGVYSPDDVLAEEGENPQPNGSGKIYYRPANMGIVGEDGKITMPAAPAGGEPKPGAEPGTEPDNQPQRSEERCGGKGGKPGPCAGGGKKKEPANAKVKAAEGKVKRIQGKIDKAKKGVESLKADLKTAKADLKKVKDNVKKTAEKVAKKEADTKKKDEEKKPEEGKPDAKPADSPKEKEPKESKEATDKKQQASIAEAADMFTYPGAIAHTTAVYNHVKKEHPDMTPEQYKDHLNTLWKAGAIEPKVINEVAQLNDKDKSVTLMTKDKFGDENWRPFLFPGRKFDEVLKGLKS